MCLCRYMLTGRVEIRDNVRSMFALPLISVVQERRWEQWDVDGHSTGLERRHTGTESEVNDNLLTGRKSLSLLSPLCGYNQFPLSSPCSHDDYYNN